MYILFTKKNLLNKKMFQMIESLSAAQIPTYNVQVIRIQSLVKVKPEEAAFCIF